MLNKYDKKRPLTASASEGTAFAQKEKKGEAKKDSQKKEDGDDKPKKNFYENKICFICNKKGHRAKKCPERKNKEGPDEDSSLSSNGSKKELNDLGKQIKKMNKQFTQMKAMIKEDNSNEDNHSHFQFMNYTLMSSHTTSKMMHDKVIMKQAHGKLADLNLWEVIFFNNQLTMSLFCNKWLVSNVQKLDEPLTLQSNGGSLNVNHIADIGENQPLAWFSSSAITNILSLKEVMQKYHVTYDSCDEAFVVYWEEYGMPNMLFTMHNSGLHFYNPKKTEFTFIVTVKDNMKSFSRWQITAAEKAHDFHASLGFLSSNDNKWILKSNQIKDCLVTYEDATVKHVTSNIVAIPKEIRKLHCNITMSINVFFVNKIPFIMTLSCKIVFMMVMHLASRKADVIFAAFKSIFKYYLQWGFRAKSRAAALPTTIR